MLGRALTSTAWGMIADRIGRKSVIILSIISTLLFNTLFGLSLKYWMAIATRFLLGSLNGLLGPIRAYVVEVCRTEHQAIGLSLVSTSWAIGLIIGPAIGGYLTQVVSMRDACYSKVLYCFFINLIVVLLSLAASRKISKVISYQFNIWEVHVFLTLFVCIVLLFGYPHKLHLASGASILLYQPFFYPHIVKVLGPVNASHVAAILSMVLLFTYPPMTHLSKPWLLVVVNIPSVLKNNLVVTIVTCSFILQNNSVPQEQRTTANGLATTLMSFFKAFAPAGAGIVFSWAQKRQHAFLFPGDQMVFFLLDIVIFVELIWTFKPLLAIPEQIS